MALLDKLTTGLQLPERSVLDIARKASHAYKEFSIGKRDGTLRLIYHPARPLKAIQRWLHSNVILHWPVHNAATAYRKGLGIYHNAACHASDRFLLRMDFTNFFPSITAADIRAYIALRPKGTDIWTVEDTNLFTALVCRHDRLTIGAPTSPALSNALCFNLDCRLTDLAHRKDVRYTRYADDLFFSTSTRDVLRTVEKEVPALLADLAIPGHLVLNPEKTRHSSKKGRRHVTGLVITPTGHVTVGRSRKRNIRRLIHRFGELGEEDRTELAGLLSFTIGIEPDFLNSLVLKYGHKRVAEARKQTRH